MKITPLYVPPRFPRFFRSERGEISPERVWCCLHEEYLYIGSSLWNLLWIFATQFRDDRHLVG